MSSLVDLVISSALYGFCITVTLAVIEYLGQSTGVSGDE